MAMEVKEKNEKRGDAVSCPQAPVTTIRQMQHYSEIVDAVLHYNLLLYPKPNKR